MSKRSGTVVPGLTRTCMPAANRAAADGFLPWLAGLLLLLLMEGPPVSLQSSCHKAGLTDNAITATSPLAGQNRGSAGRVARGGNGPAQLVLHCPGWKRHRNARTVKPG